MPPGTPGGEGGDGGARDGGGDGSGGAAGDGFDDESDDDLGGDEKAHIDELFSRPTATPRGGKGGAGADGGGKGGGKGGDPNQLLDPKRANNVNMNLYTRQRSMSPRSRSAGATAGSRVAWLGVFDLAREAPRPVVSDAQGVWFQTSKEAPSPSLTRHAD